MPGHLFLMHGVLDRLACDAWMVPCDSAGKALSGWLSANTSLAPALPATWKEDRARLAEGPAPKDGEPWVCRVQMDAESRPTPEWLAEGIRHFLATATQRLQGKSPLLGRSRPLIAVPLVTGHPGQTGPVLQAVLREVTTAARRDSADVVAVANDGRVLAAAQARRSRQSTDPWPELDVALKREAAALATRATRGELAAFIGAGLSAGAGLLLLPELLMALAARAGLAPEERAALTRLPPPDQAAVLERRIGGAEELQSLLVEFFDRPRYALGHALLAGLPVTEVVTTNYDRQFETAWESQGRLATVLPYQLRPSARRWLLKLHGCVSHPRDLVLTRHQFTGRTRRDAALGGVVQTMLITRHMLFAGFSLGDEDFYRIADAARRVVRGPDPNRKPQAFGTVLVLARNPLMEELWQGDLRWVGMAEPGEASADAAAARRLEIFLDHLAALTREGTYLLDERFETLLTPDELQLREALCAVAHLARSGCCQDSLCEPVRQLLAALGG